MRSALGLVCGFLLPAVVLSQGQPSPREILFRGGVVLHLAADSMTDKQTCKVSITSDDVWIDVSGVRVVVVTTGADVDYSRAVHLRIGTSPAFALIVPQQRRRILIPPARSIAVVRALYMQQSIRLRYSGWPDGGLFDEEIKFGDFASAYDRGVELCGWPKLPVTAVHPPVEPGTTAPSSSNIIFPQVQMLVATREGLLENRPAKASAAVSVACPLDSRAPSACPLD